MKSVPQIRVFLASPGDVNEERAVALQVFDMLEYDPLFRKGGAGGVSIHAVAWDKPGGDTAMRATKTPQTAIKEGLPRPSQCDIVIVLFWGRIGTPLPHPEYQKDGGAPYLSGTEWEFWDAVNAERTQGKPLTLIYRRTQEPVIKLDDDAALEQYKKVRGFFAQFRDKSTGALLGGVNEYTTPEDLRMKLLTHLRVIVDNILTEYAQSTASDSPAPVARPHVEAPPLWVGSPFPGLRSFTEKDAPIFFGRGLETSELVKRLEASRFIGVVAASGSGKSSLVAAGLIPRLRANAIVSGETGSRDWRYVTFTPGQGASPFEALFDALCVAFPEHAVSPFLVVQEKRGFIESIIANPHALIDICQALLTEAKAPAWAEILFFVDQFEELFTVVKADDRAAFVALLTAIHGSKRLRCIVTMRSDFYANCLELPNLTELLKNGSYPLSTPTSIALYEMITRPAERAGLQWDDGLPERILSDTSSEAGALALAAYALDELYKLSQVHDDHRLTHAAYEALDGVAGAIGKRAEATFAALNLPDKDKLLQRVFRELVVVDERGIATRQRAAIGRFGSEELALIHKFADARLLVTDESSVEVAHEAVFRRWERLTAWITEAQEDLILLRQMGSAADQWEHSGRDKSFLWPHERLLPVYAMLNRLNPGLNEVQRDFIKPEFDRLLEELNEPATTHRRRSQIGDRMAEELGDTRPGVGLRPDGIPDIVWCNVPGTEKPQKSPEKPQKKGLFGRLSASEPAGETEDIKSAVIKPFQIAKYPVTYKQYKAFLDATDGYHDNRWWKGLHSAGLKQQIKGPGNQSRPTDNHPAENVSWYDAIAFCRWLTFHQAQAGLITGTAEIRLPTESEWQHAATAGNPQNEYPWGSEWDTAKANTSESGLSRTTAVGMYPQGEVPGIGMLDMSGNVWEWCLNEYESGEVNLASDASRGLRGGSWDDDSVFARASGRRYYDPLIRGNFFGFRVVLVVGVPLL
jgi:formylglycine-generating enzyme required for sulfatase activity